MDPNNDDAAIAEFHADAKRRRRKIMAVTAVVCLLIGAAILVVTFTADAASDTGGGRFEGKTLAFGAGFVIAGVLAGAKAIQGD